MKTSNKQITKIKTKITHTHPQTNQQTDAQKKTT